MAENQTQSSHRRTHSSRIEEQKQNQGGNDTRDSWTVHDFTGIQAIGSGKFGKVFKAVERNTGVPCALKVVFKNMLEKFDFFSQMKRELEIQWRLDHPNIVKLHGYFYDAKNIYVVLEYCEHGNLYQKLRREKCFSEEKARHIIAQIVEALLYLQDRNVIHRDIKPENILLADLETLHVKLCDFGWATHTINERRTTFCGTVDYVAPELVYQEPYDEKIDLWAVGILTFELLTGQAPFTGRNENDTYSNITNLDLQKTDNTVRPFNTLSYEAQHFCQQILMTDPEKRMSLQQMRQHPWLCKAYESGLTSVCEDGGSQNQSHTPSQALNKPAGTTAPASVLGASDLTNRRQTETADHNNDKDSSQKVAGPSGQKANEQRQSSENDITDQSRETGHEV